MRLLHLSDLHYRNKFEFPDGATPYQSIFLNMTPPLVQLDRCLDLLGPEEKAQLDGVLISGDLTEDGTAADYAQLRKELESRFPGIPLIVTLGNHDDKEAFREGWLNQPPEDIPYNHVLRIGDVSILALDNSRHGVSNGILDESHFQWLRRAAEEEKGRKLILMMHHHLIPSQAVFPPCKLQPEFSSVLQELPITTILCGHTHQLYRYEYAGIPYRTAMSMSFIGHDYDKGVYMWESCGFSLYHFENGEIVSERHQALTPGKLLGHVQF